MAKFTVVSEDGRTQELHPLISETGELIWQGREVVCIREDGVPILVPPEQLGLASANVQAADFSDEVAAAVAPGRPGDTNHHPADVCGATGGDDDEPGWSFKKTAHFIELCGARLCNSTKIFRTKKAMWEDVAKYMNVKFPDDIITPIQADNKWKSLERAYKRASDPQHGDRGRRRMPFQGQLSRILEKQHHFRPQFVAGPGRTLSNTSPPEEPPPREAPEADATSQGAAAPRDQKNPKGRRRDVQQLAQTFADAMRLNEENTERRHREKMESRKVREALLRRLVEAVEKKTSH